MQDAAHAMGVQVTFDGTKDGNVKALADKVKQAVDAGYDGIAVNMIDPVAFDEVMKLLRRRLAKACRLSRLTWTTAAHERPLGRGQKSSWSGRTGGDWTLIERRLRTLAVFSPRAAVNVERKDLHIEVEAVCWAATGRWRACLGSQSELSRSTCEQYVR
jgi:hypothetical protein